MHEDFGRAEKIQRASDRSFGLVMAVVCAIVAFFPLLHAPPWAIRWWALVIGIAFAGLALFWTAPLAPLGRLWFLFGLFLAKIVNPIVLALLFYVTILPIGLLMRIFGKAPVASRWNRDAQTYWIRREVPGPPPETMKRQF